MNGLGAGTLPRLVRRRSSAGPLAALAALLDRIEPVIAEGEAELVRRRFFTFVLRRVVERIVSDAGLPVPLSARLFADDASLAVLERDAAASSAARGAVSVLIGPHPVSCARAPELLGGVFEGLLALEIEGAQGGRRLTSTRRRRATGSFFTPSSLTETVAARAFECSFEPSVVPADAWANPGSGSLWICDPACGAGAFLVAAARAVVDARRRVAQNHGAAFDEIEERRRVVERVAGVDLDPLAVAVSELALWMYVADPALDAARAGRLHRGDALVGRGFAERGTLSAPHAFDWVAAFPELAARGFDVVIGNPPWIAYAGRATQPIAPERRRFFAENYAAFRGYPTLHAVFVERAAELCPNGILALVIPSPLADLEGYRPARRALSRTHVPCEPLLEFGLDAFIEVTQPCFALIARARTAQAGSPDAADRALQLTERARHDAPARAVEVPRALARLREGERLPREVFREMGFQTTRAVTQTLLRRGEAADELHSYPLLEGREIGEFRVGPPRLFLKPDQEFLQRARCKLRAREEYRSVRFVVRQTAKVPIAALHTGMPFRNTLLAGFETEQLGAAYLVGLLNSSLYRALHLSMQRDARQAVFPQVKIAHLRALPRPPLDRTFEAARVSELVQEATSVGAAPTLRRALDDVVFSLFGLTNAEREEIARFLAERAPELSI